MKKSFKECNRKIQEITSLKCFTDLINHVKMSKFKNIRTRLYFRIMETNIGQCQCCISKVKTKKKSLEIGSLESCSRFGIERLKVRRTRNCRHWKPVEVPKKVTKRNIIDIIGRGWDLELSCWKNSGCLNVPERISRYVYLNSNIEDNQIMPGNQELERREIKTSLEDKHHKINKLKLSLDTNHHKIK